MDREMATVMANHATILSNQQYVITQLHHQHDCLERMKEAVGANSEVTEEVRQLLAAFKVVGKLGKWTAVTSAAVLSIWHAVKTWITLNFR